ncbi:hypothetical protein NDJ63_10065, partial [Vibrio alginolyticus]
TGDIVMDELSEKIINRTEELFVDTVKLDVEIVQDRLTYITWLTALAVAGFTFAISSFEAVDIKAVPELHGIKLHLLSVVLVFVSIIIGVLAKYQGHQTLYYNRGLIAIAKTQRLPFYRKRVEEEPLRFSNKYHRCGYLPEEHQKRFQYFQRKTKRWYSEEHLLYAQVTVFLIGYAGVATVLLELWECI